MASITITYQVSDGYAGASRPQTFKADTSDFIGLSESQVGDLLQQMADEDMQQRVSADISKFDETVASIMEAAAAEEEADRLADEEES